MKLSGSKLRTDLVTLGGTEEQGGTEGQGGTGQQEGTEEQNSLWGGTGDYEGAFLGEQVPAPLVPVLEQELEGEPTIGQLLAMDSYTRNQN